MQLINTCKKVQIYSFFSLFIVALLGCQSTGSNNASGPVMVGPGATAVLGEKKAQKTYSNNSSIYLDVAIPVFDPGLPVTSTGALDYEEIKDENIWPQLRRAEAKIFAVETKKSFDKMRVFSSVNVTPNANVSADLYVLGTIKESNSEDVAIEAMVIDSTGKILGKKTFDHRVSEGFFRDINNKDANPYGPVYDKVADYVYKLLADMSDADRKAIKDVSQLRYAQSYSPETYSQYLKPTTAYGLSGKHVEFKLVGKPADNDPMMKRIEVLHNQEDMFIDRLQNQYAAFGVEADSHYRLWQKETLPEAAAARKAETARNVKAAVGALALIGAVMTAKNSNSSNAGINTAALAVAGAVAVGSAFKSNEQLKVHRAALDEMGESLDITLSPSVLKLDEQTVELTGSAAEQHEQWQAHLKKIYDAEFGNLQQL